MPTLINGARRDATHHDHVATAVVLSAAFRDSGIRPRSGGSARKDRQAVQDHLTMLARADYPARLEARDNCSRRLYQRRGVTGHRNAVTARDSPRASPMRWRGRS
jgi:hypothetical protein